MLLGEGLIRLVAGLLPAEVESQIRNTPSRRGVSHPYIGHLHKPNSALVIAGKDFKAVHQTDEGGFRNTSSWPERADIVALGDSLTFGYGVEDGQAWPVLLARDLHLDHVINLGLSGAGPQQYLRVYETFGVQLRPRILVVGVFLRNDFWDADLFDRWLHSGIGGNYMVWRDFGRPQRLLGKRATLEWKSYVLARESYLFNMLHEVWRIGKSRPLPAPVFFPLPDGTQLQLFPSDFGNKTVGAKPDRHEFRLVIDALRRLHILATEQGTQTLMVFQPSKEEVHLPLLGEFPSNPSHLLRQALEGQGIECLDLAPVFRERAEAGEQLFFEVDGHPNARGYALIAEGIRSYLLANAERYRLLQEVRKVLPQQGSL
jgi:lysophospholipase L1-like esterase